MKITVLGDLHCREVWKKIVEKELDSDKIVFLGDYSCPRDVILKDPTDACGFLYEVLEFKDKHPEQVVLLRGNHDLNGLGYYWAECYPQDHPKVQQYWQTEDVKNWFLKNTQWIYQIPDTNIVCSHAGIGKMFLDNCKKALKEEFKELSDINKLPPSELFGFTGSYFDTYGDSETQPCTWIRPQTLLNCAIDGFTQVVGHTRFDNIINYKEEFIMNDLRDQFPDVWCCDSLQYKNYLVIEDGVFIVKNAKEY